MKRRDFLLLAGGAVIGVPRSVLAHESSSTQQAAGGMDAGHQPVVLPPREGARAALSEKDVKSLEGGLRCQCGTCKLDVYTCRTTDFACQVSPAMHRDIDALVKGGHSAQEIVDAFVCVYGEKVRMAPRFDGFNTIGYIAPFVAIGGGAIAAGLWISASLRRQRAMTAAAAQHTPIPIHGTKEELERIERALKDDSR
jgi:cytochrome c-type biogenesis protein CcmH